jgi:hypothetical protein
MRAFEFDKKIAFKVTPNQIHKIMQKIKEKLNCTREMEYGSLIQFNIKKIDANMQTDKLICKVQKQFIKRYQDQKVFLELKEDFLQIKEALFAFNVQYNVSHKLSQIVILEQRIKYYQDFEECLECEEDTKNSIKRVQKFFNDRDNDTDDIEIKLLFYKYQDVKKLINDANRKILELEQEISLLNASSKIEIKVYINTAELIGLG